jgi:hypothetical protein
MSPSFIAVGADLLACRRPLRPPGAASDSRPPDTEHCGAAGLPSASWYQPPPYSYMERLVLGAVAGAWAGVYGYLLACISVLNCE